MLNLLTARFSDSITKALLPVRVNFVMCSPIFESMDVPARTHVVDGQTLKDLSVTIHDAVVNVEISFFLCQ